jgi:hypothetical protein
MAAVAAILYKAFETYMLPGRDGSGEKVVVHSVRRGLHRKAVLIALTVFVRPFSPFCVWALPATADYTVRPRTSEARREHMGTGAVV